MKNRVIKSFYIWFTEPYQKKLNIVIITLVVLVGTCLWMAINWSSQSATTSLLNIWGWLAIFFGIIILAISIAMMVKAIKDKQRPFDAFFGLKDYMSKGERKALIGIASCYYLIILMTMCQVGDSQNMWTYTPYAIPFTLQIILGIKQRQAKKKRELETNQL